MGIIILLHFGRLVVYFFMVDCDLQGLSLKLCPLKEKRDKVRSRRLPRESGTQLSSVASLEYPYLTDTNKDEAAGR